MRVLFAVLVAAFFFVLSWMPAEAQRRPCGDGADIISRLEKDWGEGAEILALDASGRMVRILVNRDTGTWSMLLTAPNGLTCLVSHGSAWELVAVLPDAGEPL